MHCVLLFVIAAVRVRNQGSLGAELAVCAGASVRRWEQHSLEAEATQTVKVSQRHSL